MENTLKYILAVVLLFNLSINASSRSEEENNYMYLINFIPGLICDLENSKSTNVLSYLTDDKLKENVNLKEIREAVLKITAGTFDHHYDIHCFYKIEEVTLKAFFKSICMYEDVTEDQKKLFSEQLTEDKRHRYGRLVLIILTAQLNCLCELYQKLYDKLKDKFKVNINPEDLNGIKNRYLSSFIHKPNY